MRKLRRNLRQVLAGIVSAAMIMTALPTTSFAAENLTDEAAVTAAAEDSSFDGEDSPEKEAVLVPEDADEKTDAGEDGSEPGEEDEETGDIGDETCSDEEAGDKTGEDISEPGEDAGSEGKDPVEGEPEGETGAEVDEADGEEDLDEAAVGEDINADVQDIDEEAPDEASEEVPEEAVTIEEDDDLLGDGEEVKIAFTGLTDDGGSVLAKVYYSLDDGAYQEYSEQITVAEGTDLKFKIETAEGMVVYSVVYGYNTKINPDAEGVYSYSDLNYSRTFTVNVVRKKYKVTFKDKNNVDEDHPVSASTFYSYDNDGKVNLYDFDINGTVNLDYGYRVCFKPAIAEEFRGQYAVKAVKIDGMLATPLEAGEITIHRGSDEIDLEGFYDIAYRYYNDVDHEVEIVTEPINTLSIYRANADVTVAVDGRTVTPRDVDDNWCLYDLPVGVTARIAATAKRSYVIKSFKDITDKTNPITLKSSDGVCTVTMAGSVAVEVNTQYDAFLWTYYEGDDPLDGLPVDNNSEITLSPSEASGVFYLQLYGETDILKFDSVSAKSGKKNVEGFATLQNEDKDIKIDPSKAEANNVSSVVVTATNADYGTFKVTYNFAKPLTSLTLKGFKEDKTTQEYGTTKTYAVTLNKGADYRDLYVETTSETGNHTAEYDPVKKTLTVSTFITGLDDVTLLEDKDITITFRDWATRNEKKKFTVQPVAPAKLPAPTVKVTEATDVDMTLSLGLPASVTKYRNLYYEIEAVAAEGSKLDGRMKSPVQACVPASVTSYKLVLGKSSNLGDGTAQKYDIKVRLVQDQTDDDYDGFRVNIVKEGDVRTLKNQSTKALKFETKLGLTKKTTTVILGQRNVLLATPKFSADTSYRKIGRAWIDDGTGWIVADTEDAFNPITIDPETGGIYWAYCNTTLPAGKYTLFVTPMTPDDDTYGAPATLSLTVKERIFRVGLSPYGGKIYKAENKAATLKLKADVYYGRSGNNVKKAAGKNVIWTVSAANPDLEKALTVKNGTVTVAKDYILAARDADNTFRVTATANDLTAEEVPAYNYGEFVLRSELTIPTRMTLGNIEGVAKNPVAHTAAEFGEEAIMIYDQDDNLMDATEFTFSVTPKKGAVLYEPNYYDDGAYLVMDKPGVYTIKATTRDNRKKSLTMKFALRYPEADHYVNYLFTEDHMGSGTKITTTDGEVKQTDLKDTKLIVVEVTAFSKDGERSLNTTTVTAKGAKKCAYYTEANSASRSYVAFKPTAKDIEIKVSSKDGKNNRTYKLTNTTSTGKLSLSKKGYSFSYGTALDSCFEFGLSGVTIDPENENEKYYLEFNSLESVYTNYDALREEWDVLNTLDLEWAEFSGADKTRPDKVTEPLLAKEIKSVPQGTYKCYVTLVKVTGSGEDRTWECVTAPLKMTFKVTKAPKPSTALNSKVTMDSGKGNTADLTFKTRKNVSSLAGTVTVLNNNNNGEINEFTRYFIAECDGDKITLKRTDETFTGSAKDLTGWVKYTAIGLDGVTKTCKIEKITVTLVN